MGCGASCGKSGSKQQKEQLLKSQAELQKSKIMSNEKGKQIQQQASMVRSLSELGEEERDRERMVHKLSSLGAEHRERLAAHQEEMGLEHRAKIRNSEEGNRRNTLAMVEDEEAVYTTLVRSEMMEDGRLHEE